MKKPIQCIFCEFVGTLEELTTHSAECQSHPLMKKLQDIHKVLGTFSITFKADKQGVMQPVFDEEVSNINLSIFDKLQRRIIPLKKVLECARMSSEEDLKKVVEEYDKVFQVEQKETK